MKNMDYLIIFLIGFVIGILIVTLGVKKSIEKNCKELKIYYPEVYVTFCKYKNL